MRSFSKLLIWFALVLISLPGKTATPTDSFIIGLAGSIHDGPASVGLAKWAGATSIRLDAPWAQIERAPNQFAIPTWLDQQLSAMNQAGVEPMLILAYGNPIYQIKKPLDELSRTRFGNYSEWLVRVLRGRVKYFQLWNEWETKTGGGEPGSAEDYVLLAQTVMPRMRSANPDAILIANGLSYPGLTSSWASTFIKLRGHQLFDALATHPYVWQLKRNRAPESAIALLDRFSEKALTTDGKRMPMYVTEFGYPEFESEFGTSAPVATQLMTRFLIQASSRPWIMGVWWYGLRDQGSDRNNREHGFGIFDQNMRPKDTARALKELAPHLAVSQRGSITESGGTQTFKSANSTFTFSWKPDELPTQTLGSTTRP